MKTSWSQLDQTEGFMASSIFLFALWIKKSMSGRLLILTIYLQYDWHTFN